MLCHLVSYLLGLYPEDTGSKLMRNASNYYSSCPRTHIFLATVLYSQTHVVPWGYRTKICTHTEQIMWKSIEWPHPRPALKTGSSIIQQYVTRWHSKDVFGNSLASSQGAAPVSSTPKSCPHGKLQPSLLASIQDEITPEEPDKAEVKSHKGSCSDAQAIHLKRSVTHQVKKWKDEQWSDYRVCTIHMYTSHTHTRKRKEMSRFSIIFIGILIQHIRTMQNYAPAYQTE